MPKIVVLPCQVMKSGEDTSTDKTVYYMQFKQYIQNVSNLEVKG